MDTKRKPLKQNTSCQRTRTDRVIHSSPELSKKHTNELPAYRHGRKETSDCRDSKDGFCTAGTF